MAVSPTFRRLRLGAPAAPIRSTRPIAISHTARSSPVWSPAPGRLNPLIEAKLEPFADAATTTSLSFRGYPGLVPSYYVVFSEFFDQLEEEVIRAKSDAGVRVFNLSLGAPGMRRGLGYSVFAQALDDIAAEHDILFVVSAGNLPQPGSAGPLADRWR